MLIGLKRVLIASCLAGAANPGAVSASEDNCPFYETRDWTVLIEQIETGDQPYRLLIDGIVDAPNPTYETTFRPGPIDRRLPPAFTVFLEAKSAGGATIQVIDQRPVSFRWETAIRLFRSIRVVCGERVLVEFSDVEAVD